MLQESKTGYLLRWQHSLHPMIFGKAQVANIVTYNHTKSSAKEAQLLWHNFFQGYLLKFSLNFINGNGDNLWEHYQPIIYSF
ncbi:hypothetical protein [Cylindrospermum sp. FACHB-282]|uniref:hypothetical protein n=1 Tax=Cylindrospermum sp. FACHB-282 TaxID=2692794 RepID=UPI0016851171|nr:hypothetical protein [Cylindrospermum sp. FACHB-282]MBD2387186.1 hypothetical protein [Cylindrospermum sp. FACHB-282]